MVAATSILKLPAWLILEQIRKEVIWFRDKINEHRTAIQKRTHALCKINYNLMLRI